MVKNKPAKERTSISLPADIMEFLDQLKIEHFRDRSAEIAALVSEERERRKDTSPLSAYHTLPESNPSK